VAQGERDKGVLYVMPRPKAEALWSGGEQKHIILTELLKIMKYLFTYVYVYMCAESPRDTYTYYTGITMK